MRTQTKNSETPTAGLIHMADDLIRHLGVEDALKVCRENSWHGVIREIEGRRDSPIVTRRH